MRHTASDQLIYLLFWKFWISPRHATVAWLEIDWCNCICIYIGWVLQDTRIYRIILHYMVLLLYWLLQSNDYQLQRVHLTAVELRRHPKFFHLQYIIGQLLLPDWFCFKTFKQNMSNNQVKKRGCSRQQIIIAITYSIFYRTKCMPRG